MKPKFTALLILLAISARFPIKFWRRGNVNVFGKKEIEVVKQSSMMNLPGTHPHAHKPVVRSVDHIEQLSEILSPHVPTIMMMVGMSTVGVIGRDSMQLAVALGTLAQLTVLLEATRLERTIGPSDYYHLVLSRRSNSTAIGDSEEVRSSGPYNHYYS